MSGERESMSGEPKMDCTEEYSEPVKTANIFTLKR